MTPTSVRAHGASTNRLVNDEVAYDPITGHCRQSAIPVRVRPRMSGELRTPAARAGSRRHRLDGRGRVVSSGYGAAGASAAIEARRAAVRMCWCSSARAAAVAPPRSRAAICISAAERRCSKPAASRTARRRCTRISWRSRPSPMPRRSARTATTASRTSTGSRSSACRSSAAISRSKAAIQDTTQCLIWTGNEKVWPFRERAKPAPRGHKVARRGSRPGRC